MSKDRLQAAIEDAGIEHFDADELGRLNAPEWDGDNFALPESEDELLRIIPTLRLADAIREEWGGPVEVISGYRPPKYNSLVDGSPRSQHKRFRALDLKPQSGDLEKFFLVVRSVVAGARAARMNVGLGLYYPTRGSFAHIDTNADTGRQREWTRR